MPLTVKDFKARFGKKSVVTEDLGPKLVARQKEIVAKCGWTKGKPEAALLLAELQKAAGFIKAGKQQEALSLFDAVEERFGTDPDLRAELESDLKNVWEPVTAYAKVPVALDGLYKTAQGLIAQFSFESGRDKPDALISDLDAAVMESEKQRKRWEGARADEVHRQIDLVAARVAAKSIAVDDNKALTRFNGLRNKVWPLEKGCEFEDLNNLYPEFMDAATALTADAGPSTQAELYDSRFAIEGAGLVELDRMIGAGELGRPPGDGLGAPAQALRAALAAASKAHTEGNDATALEQLDLAMTASSQLREAASVAYRNVTAGVTVQLGARVISGKGPLPAYVPDSFSGRLAGVRDLNLARVKKANTGDPLAAWAIWLQVKDYYEAIAPLVEAEVRRTQGGEDLELQRKAGLLKGLIEAGDRKTLMAELKKPGADKLLRAVPGGLDLLDAMVKDIGTKADTPEKKEFLAAAIQARYGLKQMTGGTDGKGLSTKALPRLYKVLGLVPESHVGENDKLTAVERQKAHDTSWYSSNEKNIVLKAGTSGKTFDHTTLHEIGHAVDERYKWMDKNGKAVSYGGWQTETPASVQAVAGDGLGFYAHFEKAGVAKGLLERYLAAVLAGGQPAQLAAQFSAANGGGREAEARAITAHAVVVEAKGKRAEVKADTDQQRDAYFALVKKVKDPEPRLSLVLKTAKRLLESDKEIAAVVTEVLDELGFAGPLPAKAVWDEMAVHPAVDFAFNAALKPGEKGLWDQGDSGAARCASAGRVYQQAYGSSWYSYALNARGLRCSNYQFRAPGEWFSEAYADYYVGKLAKSHPLAVWLAQQPKR